MKIGSIVETVADFEELRRTWNLPYPKKGDVLTISCITPHPNLFNSELGLVLLYFEELPNLTGLCNKTVYNEPNFVELELSEDVLSIFNVSTKVKVI